MTLLDRQQRTRALLGGRQLDAVLLCARENLRYLCGFTGSEGALLLFAAGHSLFLTDSRYTTQAAGQVAADDIVEYRVQSEGVVAALRAAGVERIGFETSLAYGKVDDLRTRGDAQWQWLPLKDELDQLRAVKAVAEVEALRGAALLNAAAFADIAQLLRPAVTEREIALELEFALKRRGAEEKAFDFIVASGPRGALPHGVASERSLQKGELVTIDFGCRVAGYHADETVTVALGAPPPELRRVYDVVLAAHDLAIAAVRPGVALAEVDRLARDHIVAAGYGDYFGHGLGHGIGLQVHEAPTLSARSKVLAEAGMVVTVEPGIYLPGLGGVRIEDMVVVTDDGAEVLTRLDKQYRDLLAN
jgi:Xaa-Pro aminopeptidase